MNYQTYLKLIITIVATFVFQLHGRAQSQSIILGRPTDTSITASIMFDQNVDSYVEYGTSTGSYAAHTNTVSEVANIPDEIDITGLQSDTKYYYRVQYKPTGASSFTPTTEYSFHTQRAPGSTFTFTIEADEHLYDKKGVENMYKVTLANQAKDNPDFMLSLGDIFGDDHNPYTITALQLDSLHRLYRPRLGSICHSIPFYICLGNHEGEKKFYLINSAPNNIAVWGTQARKKYYPNPFPNGFYSGDTVVESYGIGNPENYYAWTWGDALFVVLDVYRDDCDTSAKPHNWDWTLGKTQYDWLTKTLEGNHSKFKFVFAHHVRGEDRGGITNAPLYEWGGYDGSAGTTYSFPTQRPGWAKPIHKLFIDNGVNIFFQGHDHLFAHEVLDSVTYQEVPMAADSTYEIGMLANASAYTADTIDGTGHIRVTVTSSCVKVDYVKAYLPADTVGGQHKNGEIGFTYTIGTCSTPTGVAEADIENGISVVPNPAKDKLIVILPANTQQPQISLVNMVGQTLLTTRNSRLDIGNIPNGIYLVNIVSENLNVVKKIVISH